MTEAVLFSYREFSSIGRLSNVSHGFYSQPRTLQSTKRVNTIPLCALDSSYIMLFASRSPSFPNSVQSQSSAFPDQSLSNPPGTRGHSSR
ncbi:hypothetical protein FJTKL_15489 [Diaporthe vaccinii]|uniref:Uncharacterized protein n=1 Tax=Diaporthe vaccinii TaxID=105482 RepID=A0ABR4F6Q5_9PEZI